VLRHIGIASIVAIGCCPIARAYPLSASLENLVQQSTRISVGTVEAIESVEGYTLARVREEAVLAHGSPGVFFVTLRPTSVCDITGVEIGERALFFLSDRQSDAEYINYPAAAASRFVDSKRGRARVVRRLEEAAARVRNKLGAPVFGVLLTGRGLMPLHELYGISVATIWDEVILPPTVVKFPEFGARFPSSFIFSVPLLQIEQLVSEYLECQGGPA
jgi:hypothetical protein